MLFPLYELVGPGLADLLKTLDSLSASLILLCGRNVHSTRAYSNARSEVHVWSRIVDMVRTRKGIFARTLGYVMTEIQVMITMINVGVRYDTTIFFHSAPVAPVFVARLMRKRTVLYVGGSGHLSLQGGSSADKLLSWPFLGEELLTMSLANRVVTVMNFDWIDGPFAKKVTIAPARIVDQEFFERYRGHDHHRRDEHRIGYVGRLSPEKGVEELVDAFSLIAPVSPSLKLQIVGDGPLKSRLESKVAHHHLQDRVEFTNWVENVEDYLTELSLLVLPSKTEGVPSVILEAMAACTPVLVSKLDWSTRNIREAENGFLLDSTKAEIMAEKIVDLMASPGTLRLVAANAYEWLKSISDETVVLRKWAEVLGTNTTELSSQVKE